MLDDMQAIVREPGYVGAAYRAAVMLSELADDLSAKGEHCWVTALMYRVVDPMTPVAELDLGSHNLIASQAVSCLWCHVMHDDDPDDTCDGPRA